MFGIGMQELLIILVLVLVIFGRAIRNYRQAASEPDESDIRPKDKEKIKTDEEKKA